MSNTIRPQVRFGKVSRKVSFDAPPAKTTAQRGYDYDWQKLRKDFIRANPLCKNFSQCRRGAVEVDHVIPIKDGGARLDPTNLQSLCKPCHTRKTWADKRRARKKC